MTESISVAVWEWGRGRIETLQRGTRKHGDNGYVLYLDCGG